MHQDYNWEGRAFSQRVKDHFKTVATWAAIVSITAFTGNFLTVVLAFNNGKMVSAIITFIVTTILNLYLLKFGRSLKTALESNSQQDISIAFQNLSAYFKFYGIMTIVAFVIILIVAFYYGIAF